MLNNLHGPIADIACGGGRNAFYLAEKGAAVIGVDQDIERFERHRKTLGRRVRARVNGFRIDLQAEPWPFARESLGGACLVHFLLPELFPKICSSLKMGSYLLIETVGGQGENYLQLPPRGRLRQRLSRCFEFDVYEERSVGPIGQSAVAVKLLARKRSK